MSVIKQVQGLYFMYISADFNLFNGVSSLTAVFFNINRFRTLKTNYSNCMPIACTSKKPCTPNTPPLTSPPLPYLLPSPLKPQAK